MADVTITEINAETFDVEVEDGDSSTLHRVTIGDDDLDLLVDGASPRHVVEASFRFLLDRERKESILPRFELGVIHRYFPEYRDEISAYM